MTSFGLHLLQLDKHGVYRRLEVFLCTMTGVETWRKPPQNGSNKVLGKDQPLRMKLLPWKSIALVADQIVLTRQNLLSESQVSSSKSSIKLTSHDTCKVQLLQILRSALNVQLLPARSSSKAVDLDVGLCWLIRKWASVKGKLMVGFEIERAEPVGFSCVRRDPDSSGHSIYKATLCT